MTLLMMIQKQEAATQGVQQYLSLLQSESSRRLDDELVDSDVRTGKKPLHYAVQQGNLSLVRTLLAYGAPLDSIDYEGKIPSDYLPELSCRERARLAARIGALGRAVQETSCVLAHLNEFARALMRPPAALSELKKSWIWVREGRDASDWFSEKVRPSPGRPWEASYLYQMDEWGHYACVEHTEYSSQDLLSGIRLALRQQALKELGGSYGGVIVSCPETAVLSSARLRELLRQASCSLHATTRVPLYFLVSPQLRLGFEEKLEQVRLSCVRDPADPLRFVLEHVYRDVGDARSFREALFISNEAELEQMMHADEPSRQISVYLDDLWFQAAQGAVKTVLYYESSVAEELRSVRGGASCVCDVPMDVRRHCVKNNEWMDLQWSLESVSLRQRVEIGLMKHLLTQLEQHQGAQDVLAALSSEGREGGHLLGTVMGALKAILVQVGQRPVREQQVTRRLMCV